MSTHSPAKHVCGESQNFKTDVEVVGLWRKSSHSSHPEGHCVETAGAQRKTGRSGPEEAGCLEANRAARLVAVRDSKDVTGPVLAFDAPAWQELLSHIKTGGYGRT
ncbi:DUF397 domain-containing protein [Spirillospora sp. NPDC127200]